MKDRTEQLISQLLAQHSAVVPMISNKLMVIGLVLSLFVAMVLLAPLGLREQWSLLALLKTVALFSFTFALFRCTQLNCQPAVQPLRHYQGVVLSLLSGAVALAAIGWLAPPLSLAAALAESSFWGCVAWIGIVATFCLLGLFRLLRRAKPLYRWRLVLSSSGLAGFLAATVYSLHCPVDALAYLGTAYVLAMLLVVAVGYVLSRRLWHW